MRIRFNIHYHTQWGQTVYLLFKPSIQSESGIVMQCNEKLEWWTEVLFENVSSVSYRYAILNSDKSIHCEFGDYRTIQLPKDEDFVDIRDSWRIPQGDSPFTTTAFADCFFKRTLVAPLPQNGKLILRVYCPHIEPGRHLAVVGNQASLGCWNVDQRTRLDESQFPFWKVALPTDELKFPLEYKYLMVDSATDEVLAWSGGENHIVADKAVQGTTIVTDNQFVRTTQPWKGAGVAIPVFSLRSADSFGVGEFLDLKKMVDWACETGQCVIQTLPINDTTLYHTNADSYPYNAVSVYALHPIYLRPEKTGTLKTMKQKADFQAKKQELEAKSFCDYQQVMEAKWAYFRAIYPHESPAIFASEDYKLFFEANKQWLIPYAAFSYLRDVNGTPIFAQWTKYSVYNAAEIEALVSSELPHYHEIAIHYFLQYHLHKQLVEVHDYARARGVAIKGDIPIGVSPQSVDAWVDPQLFNTNMQAGAPPDDFSVTGQNWGFPTYNWELMEKDGYQWWRKRFQKLAEYFDAYRIDHLLGFFRIWGIPADDVWGLTGSFQPALPFSVAELEARGLEWDEDRYLKPYLKKHIIADVFGELAGAVTDKYFLPCGSGNFRFKPKYDTQKKIAGQFDPTAENAVQIRDGLYLLHCEVLFVRDVQCPDKFHPRISMEGSATFRALPRTTRVLLKQIYIDYFYHRHTEFWKQQALKKLPALISATNMLVCGEDLGMVPDSVPDVMHSLEILSLEIQRMPKKTNTAFAMPADAPYLSVCTSSTHDMTPIRAWWEEDAELTRRFYNQALGLPGNAPSTCTQAIAERIIEQQLQSSAMLVVLPWQDWMALDADLCLEDPAAERINVPSNPANFWSYRMHISLEQLLSEKELTNKIAEMICKSGR